jgi:dolichyl-phosphate-mannose--protein O-mannosyl transferase
LGVITTYLLAKKLFNSTKVALLAAFFLTFDFLWFVHSRIALPEIFLAVFSLLACLFFWNYYQQKRNRDIILFSFFLGLALAVKWSAGFIFIGVVIFIVISSLKIISVKGVTKQLAPLFLSVLILVVVYFLTYTPYLTQGHTLLQVWQRQVRILHYHTVEIKPNATGATRPYLWPFNPLHFYYHPVTSNNQYVIAFANPLLLWGSFIALICYLKVLFKKWKESLALPIILVLSLYLPWFLISRYTFFYYFLSALPFLAIILAYGLVDLEKAKGRWGQRLLRLRSGFITGNVLGFFLFYPLLTALPVMIWYVTLLLGGH